MSTNPISGQSQIDPRLVNAFEAQIHRLPGGDAFTDQEIARAVVDCYRDGSLRLDDVAGSGSGMGVARMFGSPRELTRHIVAPNIHEVVARLIEINPVAGGMLWSGISQQIIDSERGIS